MSEKNNNKEEENLGAFASRAVRLNKDALSRSRAQGLVEANNCADPFRKILKICEVAISFEGDKEIEGLDIPLMKRLSQVCLDLSRPSRMRVDNWRHYYSINWSFPNTEQKYNDYIKPWYVAINYFPRYISIHRVKAYKLKHSSNWVHDCKHVFGVYLPEELEEAKKKLKGTNCPKCYHDVGVGYDEFLTEETTVISASPLWSFFFEASQYLTGQGYGLLCNAFYAYVLPIVIKASALMLKTISPSTYEEALKFFSTKKMEEAGSESEDSVD